MSYGKITIVGNIGSIDMRYLPDSTAITNMTIATNKNYTKKNGDKVKQTTWYKVSTFGKSAENHNKFLSVGSKCLVEGELIPGDDGNPKIWTDKAGNPRASFDVRALQVVYLDSKGEPSGNAVPDDSMSDEIPF